MTGGIERKEVQMAMKEKLQKAVVQGALGLVERCPKMVLAGVEMMHRVLLDKESKEKVKKIRKYLEDNPACNLVLIFNHVSYVDPIIVCRIYKKYIDPKRGRKTTILASDYHSDPENNPLFAKMIEMSQDFLGGEVKVMRVIQGYMLKKENREKFGYDMNKIHQANRRKKDDTKELREDALRGGITVLLSPEGTRSKNGDMQTADENAEDFINNIPNILIVPVTVRYSGKYSRGINPLRRVFVRIGKEIGGMDNERITLEQMMLAVARELPANMQGVYRELVNREKAEAGLQPTDH